MSDPCDPIPDARVPAPWRIHDGQPFWITASQPCVRKDGRMSALIAVAAYCATCGTPFTQTSTLDSNSRKLSRRCQPHRRPGVRIGSRADRKAKVEGFPAPPGESGSEPASTVPPPSSRR